jgi:formylmethanofuran:tetrahydromethanopterin formyltransferase
MKVIYNQKDNYINHIKEYCLPIIDTLNDIGKPELADHVYNNMVAEKIRKLNDILINGVDTGGIMKNVEKVIDVAFDEGTYNEGIEYAYHGKCYYFVVKRGKKDILLDADVILARSQ